ncbi:hypothetical protein ACFL40_04420 [candidate division KSB1 bacterium]
MPRTRDDVVCEIMLKLIEGKLVICDNANEYGKYYNELLKTIKSGETDD